MMMASFVRADDERVTKDLVYSTVNGRKLLLDFYRPATPPPADGYPLIISIHGGAWAGADRHNDLILRKLTNSGYALASIDYRVSGEAKYPAQIDDCREAVRWLVANAASLHVNTNKFVATGISAGGHLSLLLGLSQPHGDRTIKAVCALYGPADLVEILPPDMRDKKSNAVAALLGGSVTEKLALAREASPITYVSKDSIPILLYHGEQDKLVPVAQSIALNAAMKAAGAQSTLVIYKDKGHAFGLDDQALAQVKEFYDRCLKD
ncbi:MAG TPA: alpha/beta hydrolase [Verrucomicrobiae bacterium]|nr:alpha/beta hydrolase [Verrucomicrobiae bacterium]